MMNPLMKLFSGEARRPRRDRRVQPSLLSLEERKAPSTGSVLHQQGGPLDALGRRYATQSFLQSGLHQQVWINRNGQDITQLMAENCC